MTDSVLTLFQKLKAEFPGASYGALADASRGKFNRHQARRMDQQLRMQSVPAIITPHDVSFYDAARTALAQARTLDEVRDIDDKAAAMAEYARRGKDRKLEVDAIELRVRAMHHYGIMLGQIELSRGGRPPKKPVPIAEQVSAAPTLAEIGTDRKFSSATQKIAAIPAPELEQRIGQWRQREIAGSKPVSHDILKPDPDARREQRKAQMRELAKNPLLLPQGPFACGVADPPWENPDAPIGHTDRHYRQHYGTMTPTQVAAFTDKAGRDIASIFAPTAFLALWVTRHILAIGAHLPVLEYWRFEPKTVITWDKQIVGLGNGYTRDVTEHIVFATRGSPAVPGPEHRVASLFEQKKTSKHSEKPDWPQIQIETWFPDMSYVELFARSGREKWFAWGNEAPASEAAE
jgi:N6-adenosine-specific RNA methylase IME4